MMASRTYAEGLYGNRRANLKRSSSAFSSAVLLWSAWLNAFVNNAELHPTKRQL
jgi:hypothetical protein